MQITKWINICIFKQRPYNSVIQFKKYFYRTFSGTGILSLIRTKISIFDTKITQSVDDLHFPDRYCHSFCNPNFSSSVCFAYSKPAFIDYLCQFSIITAGYPIHLEECLLLRNSLLGFVYCETEIVVLISRICNMKLIRIVSGDATRFWSQNVVGTDLQCVPVFGKVTCKYWLGFSRFHLNMLGCKFASNG